MTDNRMSKHILKHYGFKMRAIYDVCETVTDYVAAGSFADLKKNVEYLSDPDYAQLIRTVDIKSGFSKGNFVYVNKKAFDFLWRVNLNTESIILPNIGNCGEVYYVIPEKLPYEKNVLATNAILVRSKKESNKYLFYVFQSKYFQDELKKITSPVGQTKFNKTELKNILIPLPHIKVQEEIVKILDSFTNLIDALNEELSLRQKQFEYYREKLLTFEDNHYSISRITMDDLFNFKNGYTPSTKNTEYWTNGEVNWFTVADFKKNNNVLYDSIKKVSISAVKGGKLFKPNSLLLATTATIGIHALIRTAHISNQQLTNLSLKEKYVDKIDIKYIYYYMFLIDEWCKKNYHGGGFMIVDMVGLKKQQIPIPSLSIQQSIVSKLDAFESLISSLKEEIALRQKQYEYYREKLLTFE